MNVAGFVKTIYKERFPVAAPLFVFYRMAGIMKLALLQMAIKEGQPEQNRQRVLDLLDDSILRYRN